MPGKIKFRAFPWPDTVIYFTLEDLVSPKPPFYISELVIPWLRNGNVPDEFTGMKDVQGMEIYEDDIIQPSSTDSELCIVRWNQPAMEFRCYGMDGGWVKLSRWTKLSWGCKVISNRHESSERFGKKEGDTK